MPPHLRDCLASFVAAIRSSNVEKRRSDNAGRRCDERALAMQGQADALLTAFLMVAVALTMNNATSRVDCGAVP